MSADDNRPHTRSLDGLSALERDPAPDTGAAIATRRFADQAPRRGGVARRLGLAGLGLLATTAIGVWAEGLVREALALTAWHDWTVLGGLGLTALGLLLWVGHEWRGLRRLARLGDLRHRAGAGQAGDVDAAEAALRRLEPLYAGDPAREWALAAYREGGRGEDDPVAALMRFEERVLAEVDAEAAARVSRTVRRVAAGTAVSPFPLLDMAVTAVLDLRMAGEIARLYGARPGTLASLRLLRRAFVAVLSAGALEVADDAIGEMVGVGLAGRLSGKAGAALANGLLTARLGLAAIDACRPAPWHARPRPRARTLAAGALRSDQASSAPGPGSGAET